MLRFLFILICGLLMQSCLFVVSEENAATDSAQVVNDTLQVSDSLPARHRAADSADHPLADTASNNQLQLPKGSIQTHGVHPQQLVDFAKTFIGTPYKYGSTNPEVGFDCSGFITHVFSRFNIIVPRSSIDFTNVGKEVSVLESKPGDLILFTGTNPDERFVGHMGIIVSNQNQQVEFIHSTSGKAYGVTITPLNEGYKRRYVKTIRIFPQNDG